MKPAVVGNADLQCLLCGIYCISLFYTSLGIFLKTTRQSMPTPLKLASLNSLYWYTSSILNQHSRGICKKLMLHSKTPLCMNYDGIFRTQIVLLCSDHGEYTKCLKSRLFVMLWVFQGPRICTRTTLIRASQRLGTKPTGL